MGYSKSEQRPLRYYKKRIIDLVDKTEDMIGWSYNPYNDTMYDITNPRDTLALHKDTVRLNEMDPTKTMYIISRTSNQDGYTNDLEDEWTEAQKQIKHPLIGKWTDIKNDDIYLDVTLPLQLEYEQALKTAEAYSQLEIIELKLNGRVRLIRVKRKK